MTIHLDTPLDPALQASRRHMRRSHRASFWAAQGNQVLQLHFLHAYARFLWIDRVPLDLTARGNLREHTQRQHIPAGHVAVPDTDRRAQLDFWWENLWDIVTTVYAGTPQCLPSRAELDERIRACGGDSSMQSFTDEEMTPLARALSRYRRGDVAPGPDVVIQQLLLPMLLQVELGFQGAGTRWPQRPRTDGGDVHESRLLGRCHHALEHYQAGTADIVDRIYRAICRRLTYLAAACPADPVYVAYQALIAAYNSHHPTQPVQQLHVPAHRFPDGTAGSGITRSPVDPRDSPTAA